MRILDLSWFFFIAIFVAMHMVLVYGMCQEDQKSLLLQMKNNLVYDSDFSTHLVQWNPITDCCGWSGVDCDAGGRVIGLSLNDESILRGLENATGLFGLQYLQSLNLAVNFFDGTRIPPELANLTNLRYLNLSDCGFGGQIPDAISGMTKLITLDLSTSDYFGLKLEKPNISMLVRNLTELRELYLDNVDISASGNEWGQALSSSLPNLQVLSLSHCGLSGPIDSSLANLQSLSSIRLDDNDLSSPVPEFLANYVNLTTLSLGNCWLNGTFPQKIFQVPTLETLDLSLNPSLEVFLPDHLPKNASLQTLILSDTNFSGPIPTSMAILTQLVHLDLSFNHLTGSIPSFHLPKNLNHLDLSHNALTGAISSIGWEELLYLDFVDLSNNSLTGRIPPSLFALPSLQKLQLANNQFEGQLPQFSNASSLVLDTLDLSSNRLEGHIPASLFGIKSLSVLLLSSNNLNGSVQLDKIQSLRNLTKLGLAYNRLSVSVSSDSLFSSQIEELMLASCNLSVFPTFNNQSSLTHLDLSDNKISGKIPNWIWEVGGYIGLNYLNLSHNLLVDLQEPYSIPEGLFCLDLHSNLLQGKIPYPPLRALYVDYSSNMFPFIQNDIGNSLTLTIFFSISNNSLEGVIPESICNASALAVLDLSINNFSGPIPRCLIQKSIFLQVLNLRRNNLNGSIPDEFVASCELRTLNLYGNQLEGMVPRSLANCRKLKLLDLGNNQITDEFPCWLKNAFKLKVLVLRSNKFCGRIICPDINNSGWSMLQILDLSSNNFSGRLPQRSLTNWKRMTVDQDEALSELKHSLKGADEFAYKDEVAVIYKGSERELVKILTIFTSLDLSRNHFQGPIPKEIGLLKSLYVLNLSHNALTGPIPSSVGNLWDLESFDLSFNNLSGMIPLELANLNFLSVLNLSYNHLVGRVPLSTQLQSFSPTSFVGNEGLCGPPLTNNCTNSTQLPKIVSSKEIDWRFILMAIGFAIGFGAMVTPLLFSKKVHNWYDNLINKFLVKFGM